MQTINAFRHLHSKTTLSGTGPLNCRKMYLKIGLNGVGRISFSEPDGKVGVLSLAKLETLGYLLTQVKKSHSRALVIDIDNLAGADLKMVRQGLNDPILMKKIVKTGHCVFNQLARLPVPTFAFINKACLGGAAELALACDYRIVTDDPKTLLGFPEVKLGLFPCWGGTQRLPRLVGVPQALNLIMNGESVSGKQAVAIRLADAIFSLEMAEKKGMEFVKLCLNPEGKQQVREERENILLPSWPGFAEEGYMGPGLLACELIYASDALPLHLGLNAEKNMFLDMFPEEIEKAKTLISAFLDKKALPNAKE